MDVAAVVEAMLVEVAVSAALPFPTGSAR